MGYAPKSSRHVRFSQEQGLYRTATYGVLMPVSPPEGQFAESQQLSTTSQTTSIAVHGRQTIGVLRRTQCLEDIVEFAIHDLLEGMILFISLKSMIRHPSLWPVVGADLGASIPGRHLGSSCFASFRLDFSQLRLVKTGTKDTKGLVLVLMLTLLVLTGYDRSRRDVGDTNR